MRSHSVRPLTLVLVLTLLLGGSLVLAAPPASAAKAPSIKVSATEIMVNEALTVSGKARARKGTKVRIQVRSAGRWATIATTRAKSNKTYRKKVRFASAGVQKLRVKVAGKRASSRKRVKVYQWHELTEWDAVEAQTEGFNTHFKDVGVRYTNGTRTLRTLSSTNRWNSDAGAYVFMGWDLRRQCTEFSALVGLSDTSNVNAAAQIAVATDGVPQFERDFRLGESAQVSIPVSGTLRLRVTATLTAQTELGQTSTGANIGDARVKCLF